MLTDKKAQNATTGAKPRKYYDKQGLYLEVRPRKNRKPSAKYWRYRYSYDGKSKLLSMGTYPKVSLTEARYRRDEARKLLKNGVNPSQARKAEKKATRILKENTFEALAREWFEIKSSGWEKSHSDKIIRRLEMYIFPYLGDRVIPEIIPPEILEIIRKIEQQGKIETAHRALQSCSRIFRYGVATWRVESDPTRDLKGALAPMSKKKKHFAAVTEPNKVAGLLRQLDGYQGTATVQHALQLAPLVFVRPGELRQAQWADIDLPAKEWRFTVSKTDTQHIVPLSTQAVAILESLQPLTGKGKYIFPSARHPKGDRPMSDNAILAAMRNLGIPKEVMSSHGFRAMARTLLDEVLGYRVDYIEHQLAHAVKDPNGRAYNRTTHLAERRKMMQGWADYLDRLKTGAEVMQIRKSIPQES